jgi:DNA-binding GntR family transcriptional regulator
LAESATALPRTKLTERIYQQIKQDIFDFRLLPGDRFSENEVAARLQVSRTPVREALTQLQREGYVKVLFRSGWQVNPLDFDQFDQLYDVRIVLELAAVQKLCTMEPQPNLSELKQFCAADEAFHGALIAATGNQEMARIHSDITDRLRIIRRVDFTQTPRITATYEEHAQILRAILARRSERACTLLKAHIEESKAEVRKITLHKIYETRRLQNPDI